MKNMPNLIIGSSCGGIGDNLIFTPIFKKIKNATIEMLDHPKCRNVSCLFDGMANVVFTDKPRGCPEKDITGHIAQNKLDGLGITDVNCIPWTIVEDFNYALAAYSLKDYYVGKPFLAFVADNNGSKDPSDWQAHHRLFPKWQEILDLLSERYTILQFGLSSSYTKFNNVRPILDVPLKKLAAIYKYIGAYVGIDTGDYHLMLAVGGISHVLVPPPSPFYSHRQWHYVPALWKESQVRAFYYPFDEYKRILKFL